MTAENPTSVYDFTVKAASNSQISLKQYVGQALLIMNVASKCGFTKGGYSAAVDLYDKFKDKGFTVLAFPCNQFGSQEPGTVEDIQKFACTKFSANFPIMAKIDVNGKTADPLYKYMKKILPGILGTEGIKWNFTSFLIDRNGIPVKRYSPGTSASTIEKDLIPILDVVSNAKSGGVGESVKQKL